MTTTESHPRKTRHAEFRFYEELNDFLPANQRKTSFRWPFFNTPAVRDVIQAIGVPRRLAVILHTLADAEGYIVGSDPLLDSFWGERKSGHPCAIN